MKFLAQPLFLFFFVPLITVVLTILLKLVCRNDKNFRPKKEDFAVGLDIAVIALVFLIKESANLAHQIMIQTTPAPTATVDKLIVAPWIMLAWVIGILGVALVVRYRGYKDSGELNIWCGIVAPDIVGIAFLFYIIHWISK